MTDLKSIFLLYSAFSVVCCFPALESKKKKPLELPKYLEGLNTTFLKGVKVVPESYFDLVKRYRLQPLRMYTNFYVRKKNDDLIPVGKNVSEETFNNMEQFVKQYSSWPLDFHRGSDMDSQKISEEDPSATSQRTNTRVGDGPKGGHLWKAAKKNKDHKRETPMILRNGKNPLKASELMLFFKFEHPLSCNAKKNNLKMLIINANEALHSEDNIQSKVSKRFKLLSELAGHLDKKAEHKTNLVSNKKDIGKISGFHNPKLKIQKEALLGSKVGLNPEELSNGKSALSNQQPSSIIIVSGNNLLGVAPPVKAALPTHTLLKVCPTDTIPLGLDVSKLKNFPQQFTTSTLSVEVENLHLRCEKLNGLLCNRKPEDTTLGNFDSGNLVRQKWLLGNSSLPKTSKFSR